MSIRSFIRNIGFQPRRWIDSILTYPRYLGTIKPQLLGVAETEVASRLAVLQKAWWPKALSVPVGKRILALSPHPDDESVGAGGLLWAHREMSEIHVIIACKGDRGGELETGPWQNQPVYIEKLVSQRKTEISNVCKLLGAKSINFLEYPDGEVDLSIKSRDRLKSLINEIQPDIVLLPWFLDNLKDHRILNILYASACNEFACTVLGYEVWSMLHPNAFLDISGHIEGKLQLVRQYTSQLRTVDYEYYVAGLARTRAFHYPISKKRDGAVEAYLALPNHEYCELVNSFYGTADAVKESVKELLQ